MKWVRPIISFAFTSGVIYGFVKGLINPQEFLVLAALAIKWWYDSRNKEKEKSNG